MENNAQIKETKIPLTTTTIAKKHYDLSELEKSVLFTSKEAAPFFGINHKNITKFLLESGIKSHYDTKLGSGKHWSLEQFLNEAVIERFSTINKKLNKETIEELVKKILKSREDGKERGRIRHEESIKAAQELKVKNKIIKTK